MCYLGALNLQNCTINRFIPIWLVVSGFFAAFQQLGTLVDRIRPRKIDLDDLDDDCEDDCLVEWCLQSCFKCFSGVVGCFNFSWFIVGKFFLIFQHCFVHYTLLLLLLL